MLLVFSSDKRVIAEWQQRVQRAAENIENNPWVHARRRVIAEADRADSQDDRQRIIDDFVRRFKARRQPAMTVKTSSWSKNAGKFLSAIAS
jgi:hypothetical protein